MATYPRESETEGTITAKNGTLAKNAELQESSPEHVSILHEVNLGQHTLFIMSNGSIDLLANEDAATSAKMNQLSSEERCITLMRYLFVDMAANGAMTDQMLRLNTGYILGFINKIDTVGKAISPHLSENVRIRNERRCQNKERKVDER